MEDTFCSRSAYYAGLSTEEGNELIALGRLLCAGITDQQWLRYCCLVGKALGNLAKLMELEMDHPPDDQ